MEKGGVFGKLSISGLGSLAAGRDPGGCFFFFYRRGRKSTYVLPCLFFTRARFAAFCNILQSFADPRIWISEGLTQADSYVARGGLALNESESPEI